MESYVKMTPEQEKAVRQVAQIYNLPVNLLAAIGWHETHWGELGAGREGWYLGYGYYPGSTVAEKYRGLVPQLTGAAKQIASYFKGRELTEETWLAFSRQSWRAGDPDAWAAGTWRIYQDLGGAGPAAPDPSPALPGTDLDPASVSSQTPDGSWNINPVVIAAAAVILVLALTVGLGLMTVGAAKA